MTDSEIIRVIAEFSRFCGNSPSTLKEVVLAPNLAGVETIAKNCGFPAITQAILQEATAKMLRTEKTTERLSEDFSDHLFAAALLRTLSNLK